jgi:hypothetical protein
LTTPAYPLNKISKPHYKNLLKGTHLPKFLNNFKMDEESIPKEIINKIIIIFGIILIQIVLFLYFIESGILLVFGISIFLLIFTINDKAQKKKIENKILYKEEWFKSKYTLSKEIP